MKIRIGKINSLGLATGVFCLLVHWFMPAQLIEKGYGKGIFPFFAWIFDHSVGLLPVPFLYILCLLAAYLLYRMFRAFKVAWRTKGWIRFLTSLMATAGYVVGAFYLFWGFNYDRIQLVDRLNWPIDKISNETLLKEAQAQVELLSNLVVSDRDQVEKSLAYQHYRLLEVALRQEAMKVARDLGYLDRKRVRCRQLWPSGILLRISTAGFYNPFSGECNIDRGLHPLQKPFSMAHEFFHGMGVTGEGDCNFLAYLVCHQSDHPFIRYSGELGYWRYLRHTAYLIDREAYKDLAAQLPQQVQDDLEAIDMELDKYPDIAPRMRNAIYSAYLRSNKIHDGIANYNRILQLVINWRKNGEKL